MDAEDADSLPHGRYRTKARILEVYDGMLEAQGAGRTWVSRGIRRLASGRKLLIYKVFAIMSFQYLIADRVAAGTPREGLLYLKTPASKDTLHAYLPHLEDAFLVHTLPIATTSERRRVVNPRKVFPADPGLIALFDRSGRANLGHALETTILLALLRRGADVAQAAAVHRTGAGGIRDPRARRAARVLD